jgi:hypothetical protein
MFLKPSQLSNSSTSSTDQIKNLISTQNQASSINTLNQSLNQLTQFLSCSTPECQQAQQLQTLQNNVDQAQELVATAPTQLANAQKDLWLFQGGEPLYNEHLENEFQSQASQLAKTFQDNFQQSLSAIQTELDSYRSLLTNDSNVLEFYHKLTKENLLLKKDLYQTKGVVITNTRKSIYEYQIIENLESWRKWFRFFYQLQQ